ncbi:MAG: hypothetical protein M1817_004520 [Caeruleum heppii]|nr:MAG: hypothetical protein M1817_004520 [Caeruleum heppii]
MQSMIALRWRMKSLADEGQESIAATGQLDPALQEQNVALQRECTVLESECLAVMQQAMARFTEATNDLGPEVAEAYSNWIAATMSKVDDLRSTALQPATTDTNPTSENGLGGDQGGT